MVDFIETRADVLAMTVSGRLTGDDVSAMRRRLERALDEFELVNLFVETRGFSGIELADLPGCISDALPLFFELRRLGRVAVVADQAWVRIATRLEGAVLPGISYRVFEPEQRDAAFRWVLAAPSGTASL